MSESIRSLFGNIELPSGDVTQPWSWWYQFAPVTINQMKSGDPALERRIVHEVASYGRQLGRICDALQAVVAHMERKDLDESERQAVDSFSAMVGQIAALKEDPQAPTADNLDRLVSAVSRWKSEDSTLYEQARQRLLGVFGEGRPPGGKV